jgi:hypothetical protein
MTKNSQVPPLRQSVYEDMACAHLYGAKHVAAIMTPGGVAAARGIEIHAVFAGYISHLVKTRRRRDLDFFDKLMEATSTDARAVLERFKYNHDFDPEKIVDAELEIALDEDFEPIDTELSGTYSDRVRGGRVVAYRGRLDLVQLHSRTRAQIDDWKSYFQIVNADTFQSKFYPLLLFCRNPALEKITFVLEFVRYGASRKVEYLRSDVPWLKEVAQRARKRQKQLHELISLGPSEISAAPGRHCTWCPLLLKGCPLERDTNPYASKSPEEHLKYLLWLREANKQTTEVLKTLVRELGPIECQDQNGVAYEAGFAASPKTEYPCSETTAILQQWMSKHPEDRTVAEGVTMSGLNSLLKAKKRKELAENLAAVAKTRTETEFRVDRKSPEQLSTELLTLDEG